MDQALTPLPDESFLHLRGAKIPEFLQGQLTCDLRLLTPTNGIPGAMCNVKGRVLCDLWVVPVASDHCLLRLRRSVATPFAENLRRYAQFSRIEVTEDPRPTAVVGITGDEASIDALAPGAPGACHAHDGLIVLRSGRNLAQVLLLPDAAGSSGAEDCAARLGGGFEETTPAHWYGVELAEGHYAVGQEDWERFTPQALNYDLSSRVAFDKGCYTGQEVVARLHYKGEAKRRLAIYHCAGHEAIARAETLTARDGTTPGETLRTEPGPDGSLLVAAMVAAAHHGDSLTLADGRDLRPVAPGT